VGGSGAAIGSKIPRQSPAQQQPAAPAGGDWSRTVDPASGKPYWYNRRTSETTWTDPGGAAPAQRPQENPLHVRRDGGGSDDEEEMRDLASKYLQPAQHGAEPQSVPVAEGAAAAAAAEAEAEAVSIGRLMVTVVGARQLPAHDAATDGTTDPYALLKLTGQPKLLRTATAKESLAPEWGEELVFSVNSMEQALMLMVYDEDMDGRDDVPLGKAEVCRNWAENISVHSLYP
jgi:hypothetical protein